MKKYLALFAAILIFMVNAGIAQAQETVYTDGNIRIDQYSDGWKIVLGNTVMAFGDGVLDVDNLPPAFQNMLDAYAKMEEPKAKKSLSKSEAVSKKYGPLLKTAWNQGAPYNNLCPQIKYTEDDVEKTGYALVGCSSVSTAQILNYYGYCKPFNNTSGNLIFATGKNDNPTNFELVTSDFFSKSGDEFKYNFPAYTPNFDIIPTDKNELAKFLLGIGLAQQAAYGIGATWTYTKNQIAALKNVFGYTVQSKNDEDGIKIKDLTDEVVVEAIKAARPVIIGSSNQDKGGHSYIIDGYIDGGSENNFVHIDYGYGGNMNGWFASIKGTNFPDEPSVIIAYPNMDNCVAMQHTTTNKLVINNKSYTLQEDGLLYKSAKISLDAGGEYPFYFYYENETDKIAPYTAGEKIILGNGNRSYTKRGCFTSEPATIQVENNCDLVFYHDVAHGEIRVEMIYESKTKTISGNVVDENKNTIKGATIFASTSGEQVIISQNVPVGSIKQIGRSNVYGLMIDFVPNTDYITGFDLFIIKKGVHEIPLKVSIASNIDNWDDPELLWNGKEYESSMFSENESIRLDQQFDEPIKVTKGQTYYILISNMAEKVSETEATYYYYCKLNEDRTLIYTVYGVDNYATTDKDGNYSMTVSEDWSGKLTAQYDHKVFDPVVEINESSSSVSDANFSTNGSEKYGPLSISNDGVATLDGNYDGTDEMKLPSNITVKTVKLERTFTKDVYSTIILPFKAKPSEITNGKFYTFNRVEYVIPKGKTEYQWTAFVDEITDNDAVLEANKPYIFQATSDNVESLTWIDETNGITLEKTPTTISTGDKPWVFKGVYQTKTWYKPTPTDYGFAGVTQESKGISIGDFVRAGNGSIIRPFRCYLTYTDTEYEALLSKSAVVLPERIEVCVIKHDETAAVIEPSESVEPSADDITTPVSEIAADNSVKVWSYEKTIFIEGQSGVNYRIFDANGRLLKSDVTRSDREEIAVNRHGSGIAIVIAGGKTWKVAY